MKIIKVKLGKKLLELIRLRIKLMDSSLPSFKKESKSRNESKNKIITVHSFYNLFCNIFIVVFYCKMI